MRKWATEKLKNHKGFEGKNHKPETIEKMKGNKSHSWKGGKPNCKDCGKKLSEYTYTRCRKCSDVFLRGENSPKWKGGLTPLALQIRHCFEYRQWRSDIFTRDNFTCVLCEARSGNGKAVELNADHYPKKFSTIFHENNIKSLEQALNCEEFWNINNGRTLCVKCHGVAS